MNAGKAVYGILSGTTAVTDIVGTRIFPEIAEQEAVTPFIIYQLQSVAPEDTHDGPSKLDEVRFEFLCYADSYNEAADLGVAVRGALDRVSGTYNGVNVESVQFNDVDVEIEYDPRRYSQVLKFTFRIKRDYIEIALGTPVTGAQLGDLSDVNVDGVTDNQILSYDAATDSWIPAADAGGAEQLNDLSDVNVVLPDTDEFLRYDGAEWVNDTLSISQVQGLQAALDATPDALSDLSDVDAAQPTSGQLLSYGQGDWVTIDQDEITLPIDSVTGLQAALDATPDALDDLTDVKIVGTPVNGEALVYSSGFWARGTAGASTLGALTDVNLTTPSTGAYLQYDGANWIDSVITLPSVPSTYYHNRYATEAETLRAGATATVELYYTAQADGDGYAQSAESDTATTGFDIRRKLYYSEAAQADCDTGTWLQFADIADDTTFASAKATLLAYLKERTGGTVPISLKMTWEEVAEAPSFTGLLNESYGSGAAAAYSVRRLNGLYTGAAIEVERSSDNQTQDIGFDVDGNLDESALTTFCTGTVCKVRTWYDQSVTGGTGSGNDAVQTTHANQPTIYTGGAIVKENGRPYLHFESGTTPHMDVATEIEVNTMFTTAANTNESGADYLTWHTTRVEGFGLGGTAGWNGAGFYDGSLYTINFKTLAQQLTYFRLNSGNYDVATNGATVSTIGGGNGSLHLNEIGRGSGSLQVDRMQEFVIYGSDKSTDRTSIESNIGDYFTQNTPLLDTYTGAAAAYSLRKLRTAYTGNAIRVRRASDNTEQDIGFNVFGELDTVSLASFCSGTNGFVVTWYDQSGNGNDATQTTAANQPKIYDSVTGVVTENGKPAVQFNGSTNYVDASLSISADFTTLAVATTTDTSTNGKLLLDETNSKGFLYVNAGDFNWYDGNPPFAEKIADADTTQNLFYVSANSTNSVAAIDGTDQNVTGIANAGYGSLRIGGRVSTPQYWTGNGQEFIFYSSDKRTDRTGIESNINTFYSIY